MHFCIISLFIHALVFLSTPVMYLLYSTLSFLKKSDCIVQSKKCSHQHLLEALWWSKIFCFGFHAFNECHHSWCLHVKLAGKCFNCCFSQAQTHFVTLVNGIFSYQSVRVMTNVDAVVVTVASFSVAVTKVWTWAVMVVTCAVRAAMTSTTLFMSTETGLAVIASCDFVEIMVEDVLWKMEKK